MITKLQYETWKYELLADEEFQKRVGEELPQYTFTSHCWRGRLEVVDGVGDSTTPTPIFIFGQVLSLNAILEPLHSEQWQVDLPLCCCYDNTKIKYSEDDTTTHYRVPCVHVKLTDGVEAAGDCYIARDFIILCDITHTEEGDSGSWDRNKHIEVVLGILKKIADVHRDVCNCSLYSQFQPTTYIPEITLGADPEFLVYHTSWDRYISASAYITDNMSAQIGCDGAGFQLEFRPTHADSPNGLVENFRSLLCDFSNAYPDYSVVWNGDYEPLGGHIHFNIFSQNRRQHIIDELDRLYCDVYERYNGEARDEYAVASAWREQDWGFEYRSLPSCMWLTPSIALTTLEIAHGIATGKKYDDFKKEVARLKRELRKCFGQERFDLLYNWGVRGGSGGKRKTYRELSLRYTSDCEMSEEFKTILTSLVSSVRTKKDITLRIIPSRKERRGIASFKIKHAGQPIINLSTWNLEEVECISGDRYVINVAISYHIRKSRNNAVLQHFFNAFWKYITKTVKKIQKGR